MLIVALNYFVLSIVMTYSFSVPITWLSLAGSMKMFNKTTKVVTFQLMNDKLHKLTKWLFAQIMKLSYTGPFYEVTNKKVIYIFNKWVINHFSVESVNFKSRLFPVCGISYLEFFYDACMVIVKGLIKRSWRCMQ